MLQWLRHQWSHYQWSYCSQYIQSGIFSQLALHLSWHCISAGIASPAINSLTISWLATDSLTGIAVYCAPQLFELDLVWGGAAPPPAAIGVTGLTCIVAAGQL
jgi:hypothetical protein